jgi:molybdopterin-binding protein
VTHVHLDLAGEALMASITTATAEDLALRPGDQVMIALKATAIHLI